MNLEDSSSAKHNAPVRYNPREINLRGIAIFAALIIALVVIVFPTIKWFTNRLESTAALHDASRTQIPRANSRPMFPAPRDQLHAPQDLAAFNTRQQQELNSYGWIDRSSNIVRIPIAHAMELLVQRESTNQPKATNGPSLLEIQQQRPSQTNSIIGGAQ